MLEDDGKGRGRAGAGGAPEECGRGLKEGGRDLASECAWPVLPAVFHRLAPQPLLQVLGAERSQGHLVDHTHPYPHDHFGTAGPHLLQAVLGDFSPWGEGCRPVSQDGLGLAQPLSFPAD